MKTTLNMPEKTKDSLTINLDKPNEEFTRFLDDIQNRRIIFSGAFGSGKTYFLKKFFADSEKYCCIRLAPVNYSVSQNEDIFELIKFDILFQIFSASSLPSDLNFSKTELLRCLAIFLDPEKGIKNIIEKANKTGHNIFDLSFDNVIKLLEEKNNPSDITETKGIQKLQNFLIKHNQGSGNLYEQDVITKLIFILISELSKEKESVLIIDDLDRIDPEHIFRILNVFAAHFDIDEEENKFGLDRIIVVCDIQNIRRIFNSKYGQNTDFSGYIDEFYSRRVFLFDNKLALESVISQVLTSLHIIDNTTVNLLEPIRQKFSKLHEWVLYVLLGMVKCDAINLRSITKMYNQSFYFKSKVPYHWSYQYYYSSAGLFQLLLHFAGDVETLRISIQRCNKNEIYAEISDSDLDNKHKLGFILPILHLQSSKISENSFRYQSPESQSIISYQLIQSDASRNDLFATNVTPQGIGVKGPINIFEYMLLALEVLHRGNHI